MNLLVVGGGGREHAIIKKLKENPSVETIYALPGNGGIAQDAVCVPEIGAKDIPAIVEFAKSHAIDIYTSDEYEDILADGVWQNTFKVRPEVLTAEEKKAWIATQSGVTVGSDAFFPFGDNVERARKSGVQYIAEPGGSIRDDHVIATANKYGITMCFTGMRLFHH